MLHSVALALPQPSEHSISRMYLLLPHKKFAELSLVFVQSSSLVAGDPSELGVQCASH